VEAQFFLLLPACTVTFLLLSCYPREVYKQSVAVPRVLNGVNFIEKQILIGGRYSLRDPLGSGGMAEVFLAYEGVLERDVALKILKEQYADDPGFVERFRREAQSAASLNHPNIVHIYDWGGTENGEVSYIAMEYASGGTLEDRILEDGALPPRTAAEVASQIAEALGFAHERGVIHRDIKPQNILLNALGDAKVTDFGLARVAYSTSLSQTSLVLGTASYMSPEQAMGGPTDPRSDLYSLGVVLYEMLTGELPYEGDSSVTIAVKHVIEPPRAPGEVNSEVPEGISALTQKLLAKDPGDRYRSATQLIEDLRRVRDGLPPAFADAAGQGATDRAVLPVPPVPTDLGGDGVSSRSYVVYGRRSGKLLRALGAFVIVLLALLLCAAVWSPSAGAQDQAPRVQDMVRGSCPPTEAYGAADEGRL
jgi:eukaryotic-like serine/threonine-protein kinase